MPSITARVASVFDILVSLLNMACSGLAPAISVSPQLVFHSQYQISGKH